MEEAVETELDKALRALAQGYVREMTDLRELRKSQKETEQRQSTW